MSGESRDLPHAAGAFDLFLGGLPQQTVASVDHRETPQQFDMMIPIGYNVWEMYGKSLLFSPRNVHFTLSKMTIANQTQLTSICFGCDRAALSASSLVGELT